MTKDIKITTDDKDYIASAVRGLLYDERAIEFEGDMKALLNAGKEVLAAINAQDGITATVKEADFETALGFFDIKCVGMDLYLELQDDIHNISIKPAFNPKGRFQRSLRFFIHIENGETMIYKSGLSNGDDVRDKKSKMNFDTEEGRAQFFDFLAQEIVKRKAHNDFKRALLGAVNPAPVVTKKAKPAQSKKFRIGGQ